MADPSAAILLVEGDPLTVELYQRELSREFAVITCTDIGIALDLIQMQPIAAVVLEPALAGGQGWQILAAISAACAARAIPILICSTLDERRRALNMGAAAYLVKPTLPAVLRERLREVLAVGMRPQR